MNFYKHLSLALYLCSYHTHSFCNPNLLFTSIIRKKIIPCSNKVLYAAEECIEEFLANTKNRPCLDLAIHYTKYGSNLAKFYKHSKNYEKMQNALLMNDFNLLNKFIDQEEEKRGQI